ncbi:GntR family transcriptional regulator [Amycolatopsis oliviviridis]|uniref:GntR family transcriptional regulator n=1 Tax=Amycolatopsis oliviviridis TaxID=1471590 RepID=A0ABQ3LFI9_9PSEU|nr:GntR family transcriptional regulator [Amycolatopsis oliviviridis]GHH14766.1 GntR family transcriptional regulator [Amycolatopsis oliviviridis]
MAQKDWAMRLPAVKSKADLVYDNLREGIVNGVLKPGDRINMDELSRTLGVSKIPIREAVKRLESDGFLDSRVHSGVVVARVDQTEMRGVFLARGAIEGLVARLAADKVSDGLLVDLEATQRQMRDDLRAGRVDRLAELNSEFHRRLAESSGYRILADLTEQLLLTVRRYRVVAPVDEQNWESVVAEHDAIIAALRGGDSAAAAAAAEAHIMSQAGQEISES